MNIYKIIMTHAAPKDNKKAIQEYVIAKDDIDVFNYLKYGYAYWKDYEDEEEYEDGEDKLKEIWENKGDSCLDSKWEDLYYGSIMYDWEVFKENISEEDILALERLEIAKIIK